jgi:hypothetical protein
MSATRKFCDEIAASLYQADAKQRSKPVIEAAALPQSKLLPAAPTITGRIENAPGALSRPPERYLPFRLRRMLRELNQNLGDELQSITGVEACQGLPKGVIRHVETYPLSSHSVSLTPSTILRTCFDLSPSDIRALPRR